VEIAFQVQLFATLALTGLIWTVQLVHYPMFGRVHRPDFEEFHRRHASRITWIVGPLMPAELVTAILLVAAPPESVPQAIPWIGLALVGVIWLSTAFLQVPQHHRLAKGYDAAAHGFLVRSNWIRTGAWTLRAVLLLALV
jgi:hypothetical protein